MKRLPLACCLAIGCQLAGCGGDGGNGPGPGGSNPTHPAGIVNGSPVVANLPFGVAITPGGRALVTRLFADSVSSGSRPFSGFSSAISTGLGSIPTDVAIVEGGTKAYTTNQGTQEIGILDLSQNVKTGFIPVGGDPFRVYAPAGGHRAYVTTNADSVFVINTSNNAIVGRFKVGPDPNGVALSPDGASLYVSHSGGTFVYRVNTATNAIVDSLEVGGVPQDLVVAPGNTRLYIANEALGVQSWDIAGDSIEHTLPMNAFGMAMSPDGVQLYVSDPSNGKIYIIDRASFALVGNPITVGGAPRRIAFSQSGTRALITNENNFVTVVR